MDNTESTAAKTKKLIGKDDVYERYMKMKKEQAGGAQAEEDDADDLDDLDDDEDSDDDEDLDAVDDDDDDEADESAVMSKKQTPASQPTKKAETATDNYSESGNYEEMDELELSTSPKKLTPAPLK